MNNWGPYNQQNNNNDDLLLTRYKEFGYNEFNVKIEGTNNYKKIKIILNQEELYLLCSCDSIFKYNIKYIEEYYSENSIYDIVIYVFEIYNNIFYILYSILPKYYHIY